MLRQQLKPIFHYYLPKINIYYFYPHYDIILMYKVEMHKRFTRVIR